MSATTLLLIALGAPLLRALLSIALPRPPGLRDVINILFALIQAVAACMLVQRAALGETAAIVLARPLPDVAFALSVEPLGVVVAATVSVLGAVHAVHMAGYVRATNDPAPARLTIFVSLASLATLGVAFAENLFTLFVFYQGLTLASLPLVAHAGDETARRSARVFLSLLLASSIGLLLPAIVWTYASAGDLTFRLGGVLGGHVTPVTANVLLVLFTLGYAKAPILPLHRWIAAASASTFPSVGVVYALAVVPAGAVALLKTVLYVFGPAMADARIAAIALITLASLVMVLAAAAALGKADVRARIGYALIAQTGLMIAGAMLATPPGIYAALLQVIAQSVGVLTLVLAFGAVHAATGRVLVHEMDGLGRLMPATFAGVAIGAASLVGLPPLAGAWPKLWFMTASAEFIVGPGQLSLIWAGGLAAAGAITAFACLAPLAARAFVAHAPPDPFRRPDGASILLVAPILAAAAMTLALIVFVDALYRFLTPIWVTAP